MVRRSFRIGLRLGLLFGVAFAVFKTLQSRRSGGEPAAEPWQPIVDTPRPRPERTPETPVARPTDEVGEPVSEPPAVEREIEVAGAPGAADDGDRYDLEEVADDIVEPEPVAKFEPVDLDAVEPEARPERSRLEMPAVDPVSDVVAPAGNTPLTPLDILPGAAPPPAVAEVAKKPAKTIKAAKKAAKAAAKKAVRKKAAPPVVEALGAEASIETEASTETDAATEPVPVIAPPSALEPYVEPVAGVCPTSHPVKVKVRSRLFHLPGMFAYDRTRADRCYVDADAAEADGFTRSRR